MCSNWRALTALSDGKLLPRAYLWILITGAVVATTVHAQDFPDIEGDEKRGRQTLPMLPLSGRLSKSLSFCLCAGVFIYAKHQRVVFTYRQASIFLLPLIHSSLLYQGIALNLFANLLLSAQYYFRDILTRHNMFSWLPQRAMTDQNEVHE